MPFEKTRARHIALSAAATAVVGTSVTLSLGLGASSCGAADFDPPSKIQSVRVLATRASKPYAAPGEEVTIELLAHDGRKDKSRPMRTYWIPVVCINPARDAYFACFQQLAGGSASGADAGRPPVLGSGDRGDAGSLEGGAPPVPGSLADLLRPGVDISPLLPEGPKFSFTLPKDIVTSHAPVPGAPTPYGLAIVFNITCTGQVRLVSRDNTDNPQAVPIGCFDENGSALGPDEFVFGFTRVYAYETLTNKNPRITGVRFDGKHLEPPERIVVDRCTPDRNGNCAKHKVDVEVPDDSQEPRPGEDSEGHKERLWAAYYATDGKFGSELRILFDSNLGRISEPENEWEAPSEPGEHKMWIIVRDNRAGADWIEVPVVVN